MLAAMHPVLEQLQRRFNTTVYGLTAAETQLRTGDDPARWSIQQIVEHLLMTYALSAEVFERRIARGTPTKAEPTFAEWMGQVLVLRLGRFPQGRKAPSVVMPGNSSEEPRTGEELVRRTGEALLRFDELAANAEILFGGRRSIKHQVLGPLSVADWRQFHLIHGKHHFKQIAAIRSSHGLSRADPG